MARPKNISHPSLEEIEAADELEEIEHRASQGLEPLAQSPALNKLLLRNARQPVAVISQKTGIPAEEVGERLVALLDNPDWRDDLMEEKLLLAETAMLVEDIRTRMSRHGVEDEGWASMARVQLAAIKTMMDQLEKRRKAVDGKLSLLTQGQAELFVQALRLMVERSAFELSKEYGVPEETVYQVMQAKLPEAVKYLDGNVRE